MSEKVNQALKDNRQFSKKIKKIFSNRKLLTEYLRKHPQLTDKIMKRINDIPHQK